MSDLIVKRLHPDASIPEYKTELAAGMDLAACVDADVTIGPGEVVMVPTGLAVAIEPGFEGQVRPRSGLAVKHAVTVVNAPGTIDADYRGELRVGLVNLGREAYVVQHGARIAQLVIAPVERAQVVEADELSETVRGSGGFGSTGIH